MTNKNKMPQSKRVRLISFIILILLISAFLFVPIPMGIYKDGGTRAYSSLTYKIVKWHSLLGEPNESGEIEYYSKTVVYWLPDNFKSIGELWEMEQNKNK